MIRIIIFIIGLLIALMVTVTSLCLSQWLPISHPSCITADATMVVFERAGIGIAALAAFGALAVNVWIHNSDKEFRKQQDIDDRIYRETKDKEALIQEKKEHAAIVGMTLFTPAILLMLRCHVSVFEILYLESFAEDEPLPEDAFAPIFSIPRIETETEFPRLLTGLPNKLSIEIQNLVSLLNASEDINSHFNIIPPRVHLKMLRDSTEKYMGIAILMSNCFAKCIAVSQGNPITEEIFTENDDDDPGYFKIDFDHVRKFCDQNGFTKEESRWAWMIYMNELSPPQMDKTSAPDNHTPPDVPDTNQA